MTSGMKPRTQWKFYCDLYVSEELKWTREKTIAKLKRGELKFPVYLVTLSQGKQNHLEFFSSLLLKQHIYEDTPLFIVGIAREYFQAVELVEQIVEDVYAQTKDADIRGFVQRRQKEYEEGRV